MKGFRMRVNEELTTDMQDKLKKVPDYSYRVALNDFLINDQGLAPAEIPELFTVHGKKCVLFNQAAEFLRGLGNRKIFTEMDRTQIRFFNKELELLEFKAQKAWKFNADKDFHQWWLEMPGCACPLHDNKERTGTKYNVINDTCIWHGKHTYTIEGN